MAFTAAKVMRMQGGSGSGNGSSGGSSSNIHGDNMISSHARHRMIPGYDKVAEDEEDNPPRQNGKTRTATQLEDGNDDAPSWTSARRRSRILLPPRPVYLPLRDSKKNQQQPQRRGPPPSLAAVRPPEAQQARKPASNAPPHPSSSTAPSPPVASPTSMSSQSTTMSLSYSSSSSSSTQSSTSFTSMSSPSSPKNATTPASPPTMPKSLQSNGRCRTDGSAVSAASESSTTMGETLSHASSLTSMYTTNTTTNTAAPTRTVAASPHLARTQRALPARAERRLFSVDGSDDDEDYEEFQEDETTPAFVCHSGPVDVDQAKPIVDCWSRDDDDETQKFGDTEDGPVDVDEVLNASNRLDGSGDDGSDDDESFEWTDFVLDVDEEDCSRELVGYHEGFEPCVIEEVSFNVDEDEEGEEEVDGKGATSVPISNSNSLRSNHETLNPPKALANIGASKPGSITRSASASGADKHSPSSAMGSLRPLALLRAATSASNHQHHHHPPRPPAISTPPASAAVTGGAPPAPSVLHPPLPPPHPHPPSPVPPKKKIQPGQSLHPKPKFVGQTFSI